MTKRGLMAAFLGGALGILMSHQVQWFAIRTWGGDGCRDVISGMAACVAPAPLPILNLLGAVITAMIGVWLFRRSGEPSSHHILTGLTYRGLNHRTRGSRRMSSC